MANKISIIVPVYNAEKYIERCINSILRQTYTNWELILINDGSIDNSFEKCTTFQDKDNRIFVIDQTNYGPSIARNKGLEKAEGEYIVFIDADDFVDTYYLQKLLEPFIKHKNIELSCGGYFELSNYSKKGKKLHDFEEILVKNELINQSSFLGNLFNGITGVLWGKMFLSKIIKDKNILLDPEIRLSEDQVFIFEYAININKIALVKEYLYYYNRLNENSLSGQLRISNLKDIELTNQKFSVLNKITRIPNLSFLLHKRYIYNIIKITNNIAISNKKTKTKIRDLAIIGNATQGKTLGKISFLNLENFIHFILFQKKQNLLLIFYCKTVNKIRNYKNKI